MVVKPGINRLTLEMKVNVSRVSNNIVTKNIFSQADCDGTFIVSQFMASSKKLDFIQSINCQKPTLTVVEVMPSVTIIKSRDDLLAGTEQEVDLVIRTGSTAFHDVNSHMFIFLMS